MMTIQQRIDFASQAIAAHTGETSDQVQSRLLGNQARAPVNQAWTLERELRRLRQPVVETVVKVATATV